VGRERSTGQSAVMRCGWGSKAVYSFLDGFLAIGFAFAGCKWLRKSLTLDPSVDAAIKNMAVGSV